MRFSSPDMRRRSSNTFRTSMLPTCTTPEGVSLPRSSGHSSLDDARYKRPRRWESQEVQHRCISIGSPLDGAVSPVSLSRSWLAPPDPRCSRSSTCRRLELILGRSSTSRGSEDNKLPDLPVCWILRGCACEHDDINLPIAILPYSHSHHTDSVLILLFLDHLNEIGVAAPSNFAPAPRGVPSPQRGFHIPSFRHLTSLGLLGDDVIHVLGDGVHGDWIIVVIVVVRGKAWGRPKVKGRKVYDVIYG